MLKFHYQTTGMLSPTFYNYHDSFPSN